MKFPEQIEQIEDADRKASERLRYMLVSVAGDLFKQGHVKRPSLTELAHHCRIQPSTLCYGVRRGRLTRKLAEAVSNGVGEDEKSKPILRAEHLREPLKV